VRLAGWKSSFFAFCAAALLPAGARAAAPLNYLTGAGDKADPVVSLTWGVTIISIGVIVIISLLVAGAIWRRPGIGLQPAGSRLAVDAKTDGLRWIWIGVGISSLVLLFTVVWTMVVLARITSPPTKPALTVEVTGHQWWWQIRYLSNDPSQVFSTANEIHIPAGQPVLFRLIGADVIHSFWIPALGGKTDTIPGQQHAKMGIVLVAQAPADFAAWRAHQLQSPSRPASGEQWAGLANFTTHCGSCHSVRGTDAAGELGPDLSHLMQRQTIAAGVLQNTPQNLDRWISDPQRIKPGALMQKPELSSDERATIISYLKTLD
jgi:cytochrome c oxidase subunit 2